MSNPISHASRGWKVLLVVLLVIMGSCAFPGKEGDLETTLFSSTLDDATKIIKEQYNPQMSIVLLEGPALANRMQQFERDCGKGALWNSITLLTAQDTGRELRVYYDTQTKKAICLAVSLPVPQATPPSTSSSGPRSVDQKIQTQREAAKKYKTTVEQTEKGSMLQKAIVNMLPELCLFQVGISCTDWYVSPAEGRLGLTLINGLGQPIIVTGIEADGQIICPLNTPNQDEVWGASDYKTFMMEKCVVNGESTNVKLTYHFVTSGAFEHMSEGNLIVRP